MMTELLRALFIFLVPVGCIISGPSRRNITVCIGKTVVLFDSIKLNGSDTNVSLLYVNGDKDIFIATWTIQGSNIIPEYNRKVNLTEQGTLSIGNLDTSDQGTYCLIYQKGNSTWSNNVTLDVLIAPDTGCRPKIQQVGAILIANLRNDICGKPKVSVKWVKYTGAITETNAVKMQQEGDGGTYHACIDGLALMCDKNSNSSDHCDFLKIDKSKTSENSENDGGNTLERQTLIIVILSILSTVVLVILALLLIFIFRRKLIDCFLRRKTSTAGNTKGYLRTHQQMR